MSSRMEDLERRKADIERKLAEARAEHAENQEAALMLVPQDLLSRVRGGAVADFKAIHAEMECRTLDAIEEFGKSLDYFASVGS